MTSILFPYIVTTVATYYGSYFVIRYTTNLIIDTIVSQTKCIAWYIVSYPFKKVVIEDHIKFSEDYVLIDVIEPEIEAKY